MLARLFAPRAMRRCRRHRSGGGRRERHAIMLWDDVLRACGWQRHVGLLRVQQRHYHVAPPSCGDRITTQACDHLVDQAVRHRCRWQPGRPLDAALEVDVGCSYGKRLFVLEHPDRKDVLLRCLRVLHLLEGGEGSRPGAIGWSSHEDDHACTAEVLGDSVRNVISRKCLAGHKAREASHLQL
eukprot:2156598-Prymnesium_polylepis.2